MSIAESVNDLPQHSVTVYVLRGLDFVIPGQWQNPTDFTALVKAVTGEHDAQVIQRVSERATHLYDDPKERYQRALWLYTMADKTDKALATASLADKLGTRFRLLRFLTWLTPKADTAQSLDFSLKLIIELLAFCQINGIPGDSVGDFVKALADYSQEALMRMTALICLDGLVPLGPDFMRIVVTQLQTLSTRELQRNATFKQIKAFVPGATNANKLAFIHSSVEAIQGWIEEFVAKHELDPQKVLASVKAYIDITDDRLDYLGAFLDMSTDYYTHTGTQTLARRLIERAVNEI
jgi:hypothetical protein